MPENSHDDIAIFWGVRRRRTGFGENNNRDYNHEKDKHLHYNNIN